MRVRPDLANSGNEVAWWNALGIALIEVGQKLWKKARSEART
jgi:hypothetical protein